MRRKDVQTEADKQTAKDNYRIRMAYLAQFGMALDEDFKLISVDKNLQR